MVRYRLEEEAFVIEGYPHTRPFASFLPGIAGLWGIPMWVFYVNRGQAIAGFGIRDKDHPIMEFQPANRAYRTVPLHGFRTFLKVGPKGRERFYEPFHTPLAAGRGRPSQRMRIRPHDLTLEERHPGLGLEIRVHYFTIPQESFAALARVVTITNRARTPLDLDVIDGLPVMIPYGMLDHFLKQMSRTIEAWVTVDAVEPETHLYRLKVEPHDTAEVTRVTAGNFAMGFFEEKEGGLRPLKALIDPEAVFGRQEDLTVPASFLTRAFRPPARPIVTDKTPCAMRYLRTRLRPRETSTLYSLYGHADDMAHLRRIIRTVTTPGFFTRKVQDNRALIEDITRPIETTSHSRPFDLYCRQTYLDNLLRGGLPTVLGDKVFHVFSRKHGDLERDYNQFVLPPTPYSQGDVNYRDVNQNRRTDVWFHPEVGEANVLTFFNLLQADGFNPLILKGHRCVAPELAQEFPALQDLLSKPFTPGELLQAITQRGLAADGEAAAALLSRIIHQATMREEAEHGEGFWTDHWTYNLDLLESYLALYPERLRLLLLEQRVFTFFDNAFIVVPRAQRYHRTPHGTRQLHAVHHDREKTELMHSRSSLPHCVRTEHGRGAVYTTTLLVKMLCVIANKLASLDPSGIGVEMEAGRPNWYDALNGLPGLLGSSVCETFELKRWMGFVQEALTRVSLDPETAIVMPEELAAFLTGLQEILEASRSDHECWDRSATAKERYREATRLGFSGCETTLTAARVLAVLRAGLSKVERGIQRAVDRSSGLFRSYSYHEVASFTLSGDPSHPAITPTQWVRHDLPLFLSGVMHALRLTRDPAQARALYQALRRSPLYDKPLKMHRVCDSLLSESEEIGRCRIFTPGWLEHQSIWVHMEYKLLLELLRCGLVEEFYREFFTVLIPFQPPKRYGRSILEHSSFLVSSAHPNSGLHGSGFVARLSAATAEFLQMWLWMTIGREPFRLTEDGQVELRLSPMLPEALFDAKGIFRFRLLGRTEVTYHNPRRQPTYGPRGVSPRTIRLITRTGERTVFRDGIVPAPYADLIRRGLVERLEVELAPRARRRQPAQRVLGRLAA